MVFECIKIDELKLDELRNKILFPIRKTMTSRKYIGQILAKQLRTMWSTSQASSSSKFRQQQLS